MCLIYNDCCRIVDIFLHFVHLNLTINFAYYDVKFDINLTHNNKVEEVMSNDTEQMGRTKATSF